MREQAVNFFGIEVQPVLPKIAVLDS